MFYLKPGTIFQNNEMEMYDEEKFRAICNL